tara:strand:+ start:370 stop:612 length:243 start_codon:yes stop_codon:yes gene_type:complete
MDIEERYKKIFVLSLSIEKDKANNDLKYNDVPEWDSIGHMTLISDLEEEFKITLETDDIIDFSSYEKGKEILKEKYKIAF